MFHLHSQDLHLRTEISAWKRWSSMPGNIDRQITIRMPALVGHFGTSGHEQDN